MEIYYGTSSVARTLNINAPRLKRWIDYGFFQPQCRAVLGDTEYRLFSEQDIEALKVIVDRIQGGMSIREAFGRGGLEQC